MSLIPVLDLARGQAVQAVAGRRAEYKPLKSGLVKGSTGDALAIAKAYREAFTVDNCYVADLDAIQGGAVQLDLIGQLANPESGFGSGLAVDAGPAGLMSGRSLLELGVSRVVLGLESLTSFMELEQLAAELGAGVVLFSLDLEGGKAKLNPGADADLSSTSEPLALAQRAVAAGVGGIIVLDIADVGSRKGPTTAGLVRELVGLSVPIYAGGGVRSKKDMATLVEAGAKGVLVGTALHSNDGWKD